MHSTKSARLTSRPCVTLTERALLTSALHVFQRIQSLGLLDQVNVRIGLDSDDKVRHLIVHLPVVQVGDGESQAGVFDECIRGRVRVDEVCGRLFPLHRVRHDVVEMTVYHLTRFAARPKVHVASGAKGPGRPRGRALRASHLVKR